MHIYIYAINTINVVGELCASVYVSVWVFTCACVNTYR